jgi:HK97 gp10 family phage protein
MKVKVKIVDKSQNSIKQARAKYSSALASVIFQSANFCRNHAIQNIARGTKTGRLYTRNGIQHQASAVGEYPATDTGELIASIAVEIDADKLGASVQATAPHAEYLEFGTSKMRARPFLQPSAEATRPRMRAFLRKVLGTGKKGGKK